MERTRILEVNTIYSRRNGQKGEEKALSEPSARPLRRCLCLAIPKSQLLDIANTINCYNVQHKGIRYGNLWTKENTRW